MSIELTCPDGHTLTIPDAWAGRSGRCPVCKAPVQVPALRTAPVVHTPTQQPVLPVQPAPMAVTDPVTGTPPPLPVKVHNASLPVSSAEPDAAFATTQAVPTPGTPPPLPVVVATSYATVSRPVASSSPTGNGLARLVPPGLRPRPNQDAVFASVDQLLDPLPRSEAGVRSNVSTAALVAEVEAAASPPATAHLPRLSSDAASRPATSGYHPDADKRRTVYYLAAAMAALSGFCMLPALPHLNLGSAPDWARAALLASLLQFAYAAWVASIPDWATLRSSMIILTIVAAVYGLTMTVTLSAPQASTLPLDLTEVRRQAVLWCAGVVLLASLLAYCCGRAAWRWRRMLDLLHV